MRVRKEYLFVELDLLVHECLHVGLHVDDFFLLKEIDLRENDMIEDEIAMNGTGEIDCGGLRSLIERSHEVRCALQERREAR